jgi:phage-related protein
VTLGDKPLVWGGRGNQNPSVLAKSQIGSGIFASETAAERNARHASFSTAAVDWSAVPELRINDERSAWRIVYRIDSDAIIILDVFSKKNRTTPKVIVDLCKRRLREYENA